MSGRKIIDLCDQRFGRLTVVEQTDRPIGVKGDAIYWLCRCDCGQAKIVRGSHLSEGDIRSCGCLLRDQSKTHGMSWSLTWRSWLAMKQRCRWGEFYAGRGITLCDRWQSFENFFADMGERPTRAHSIERIDNDGNYEPRNCMWGTATAQARNRRNVVLDPEIVREARAVKARGGKLAPWARRNGVSIHAIYYAASGKTWKDIE